MTTRNEFLNAYRALVVSEYDWAKSDGERLSRCMSLAEKTLRGEGIPWTWDGPMSRKAFGIVAPGMRFTLKALRALPVAA